MGLGRERARRPAPSPRDRDRHLLGFSRWKTAPPERTN